MNWLLSLIGINNMTKFPNFSSIQEIIKKYNNLEQNDMYISIPECNIKNIKAKFFFEEDNLRCSLEIDDEITKTLRKYIGDKLVVNFGEYTAASSFILSINLIYDNNNIKNKCEIMLNDIGWGNEESFNLAAIPCHSNMTRLDKAVNFSPLQGHFAIKDKAFRIFINEDKTFIYSETQMSLNDFRQYVRSIKMALDFFNCQIVDGNVYMFLTDEKLTYAKSMVIDKLSKGSSLNFKLFIDDIYPLKEMFVAENKDAIIRLSSEQFGKLCELLVNDNQMFVTLNYILQASHLWEEYKLVYLSLAFEALRKVDLFSKKNIGNKATKIIDEKIFDKLKQKLNAVINETNLDENIKNIFKGKFNNSLPNKDSLLLPFRILSIYISEEDEKIIEKRNCVLHGTAPKYSDDIEQDIVLYQQDSYVLYSLLYQAILKIIGYNGYIINVKKWKDILEYEHSFTLSKEKKFYREDFFVSLK